MKEIKLTYDRVTFVDDEDFEYLNQLKWSAKWDKCTKSFHAVTYNKRRTIYMSRFIMKASEGMQVDHINHSGLDNRKSNLRICSFQQNLMNKKKYENGKCTYKGVSKARNKYRAVINVNKRSIHLGYFHTESEAANAYDEAASKYFKEFANLNFN